MKKNPEYRKIVKKETQKAVDDLERAFKKRWEENDDNLNEGGKGGWIDNGEDDIYNL